MASSFEILFCPSESACSNKLILSDRTGWWTAANPWAYWDPANGNSPNPSLPTLAQDGTFGYDSYTISIYQAVEGGLDMNSTPPPTPSWTFNLLTLPHTIDQVTGYVTWELTFEQLNISYIRSGWWVFRGGAVWTGPNDVEYNYPINVTTGMIENLESQVDNMMSQANYAACECSCGKKGQNPFLLYAKFLGTQNSGCCQEYDQFTLGVDYLYYNIPLASCGC